MKKLLTLLLIASGLNLFAQTYQTQLITDDPDKALDKFVVLDVVAVDLDFNFISSNVYIGGSTYWPITDKLIIDSNIKIPIVSLSGGGFGLTAEPGVFFKLSSKTKTDDVPVVIEATLFAETRYENGRQYNVDKYKYLTAKGTYRDSFGARGGLYFRQGPFMPDDVNFESNTTSTLTGLYIGFQKISQAFVEMLVSGNGLDKEKFIGAGFTKTYVDVMFCPVKTIADQAIADANEKNSPLGVRAGFQWNKNPYKTKLFGRAVYSAEIGIRPLMGFYITAGLGFKVYQ